MKQLLRNIIDFESSVSQENLILNLQRLISSKYEWNRGDDQRLFQFVVTYFQQRLEVPAAATIADYFERLKDTEVVERIKDLESVPVFYRSNFKHLLENALDEQHRIRAVALLKESQEIITKGLEIEGERKQGIRDGLQHFAAKANDLILTDYNAQTFGDIRDDGQLVWNEYEEAKLNKDKVWGKFTGLQEIDKVCHGAKKGELWVHAAYPGELKCLSGDATIFDHRTNRRRTIHELYESGELPIVTALDREGETHRLVRAETSHLVENGVREVYDLTLTSGRSIGATGNHKFFTPAGWRQLDELRPGDWVAVPAIMQASVPERFYTDAEVKVLGYLLGDGSIGLDLTFTASNDLIREDFKECLRDLGLVEGAADYETPTFREVFPSDRAPFVWVSRSFGNGNSEMTSLLRVLLEDTGLFGSLAADKHVPWDFFGLPDEQIALFLGALWSTDGSCHTGDHERVERDSFCKRNDITYTSTSRDLCKDIQSLLLRLGIQSSVTRVDTTYKGKPYTFHTVRVVTNPSKRRFVEKIHVIGKEDLFATLASRLPYTDNRVFPTDFIPSGMKIRWQGANGVERWRYANTTKCRTSAQADTIALFLPNSEVRKVLDGDLSWEQVEGIMLRGKEMTYDLSVPGHHTFVANDIVTHNTMFAMNWCYNLVTRYRSNVMYGSFEMPYRQLRRVAYTMHSANSRWRLDENGGHAAGLDYRKFRDGQLDPKEEVFLQDVIKDFQRNPDYGAFQVWSPDRDITIDDIRLEAELLHKRMEIGLIVLDHGQLIEARKKKRSKDYVVELNSIIRDAKKLALHFNQGEGIPVLMLFQINRQGKEEANKNEGRYKMNALTYANECLAEGTLVKTSSGLRTIESVGPGDHVWSRTGWKDVLTRFDNGIRHVFDLWTDRGVRVQVTGNHRVRILNDGVVSWKHVQDLTLSDYLLCDFGTRPFPNKPPVLPTLDFHKWEKPTGMKGVALTSPGHLTTDLAYLFGAHVGDGTFEPDTIGFTGNRKELAVMGRLLSSFVTCFSQDITLSKSPSRSGSFDMRKSSKALHRWFEQLGVNRQPGLPPCILEAPRDCVLAFLRGLWDTDGSINNQGILALGLKGVHESTLRQTQLLMTDLGIDTTLTYGTTSLNGREYDRWILRVRSRSSRKRFAALIGFTEKAKQAKLMTSIAAAHTSEKAGDRTNWPVGSLFSAIYNEYKGTYVFPRKVLSALAKLATRKDSLVSDGAVAAMLQTLRRSKSNDLDTLRYLHETTKPQRVMVLADWGTARVYDLEVSGDHEYATAGLLSHNCEKSADIITTTYLNDDHRRNGTTVFCNLKNRDNPLFEPFVASVNFTSRRISNMNAINSAGGRGMAVEDHQEALRMMMNV